MKPKKREKIKIVGRNRDIEKKGYVCIKVKIETKIQIEKGYKRKIKSPSKKRGIKVQMEKGYKSPNKKGK